MMFECPNGHQNYYTYDHWRKHRECPICKSNKYFAMNDKAPKRKGFRILAFDQATETSGWSVFDDQELVKFGVFNSGGSNHADKVSKTKAWFASMLQMWKPDQVILEDIQLQEKDGVRNVVVYKKLAHLQGVLENYCYDNGYIYKIVPPSTWREGRVKGRSREEKKISAQIIIADRYGVKVSQDEADAIMIGEWAVADNKVNKRIVY